MQNVRENINQTLNYTEYDVSGNVFRAYYDADGKIVFVLDFTESVVKPNVLLVINPVGNRKWDDILMNDYGVDLETVRPKKDNKYQKLDIEYAGLAEYDDLINAFKSGDDLTNALANLSQFHDAAARRAANERLGAAEIQADNARETIAKTKMAISELQSRVKTLRTKLMVQRREIGREPTKQSAAKILRTETQIDAANDKLTRAKKRLQKAQRRLAGAEEDIETASKILALLAEKESNNAVMVPAEPLPTDVVAFNPVIADENTKENIKPKANDMADEEVKPLFDTDPKILNDEIAFKPVDFGAPAVVADNELPVVVDDDEPLPMPMPDAQMPVQSVDFAPIADVPERAVDDGEKNTGVAPLSFVPPVLSEEVVVENPAPVQPVLETISPIVESVPQIDSELLPEIDIPQIVDNQWNAPVADAPVQMPTEQAQPQIQSMSEIEPAPVEAPMRPVSPIAGNGADYAPVAVAPVKQKSTVLYYVLLIILIGLSIFTLWFYQKSANKAMPELGAQSVQTVVDDVDTVSETDAQESVSVTEEVEKIEPQALPPVQEPVSVDVQPVPVPVVEAQPVQIAPVVEPQPVPVSKIIEEAIAEPAVAEPTIRPAEIESPFLPTVAAEEELPKQIIPTEEEILARKPVYGVSQNEKMFVAADDYETDDADVAVTEDDIVPDDGYAVADDTQILRPGVVVENQYLPDAEKQYVTQEVFAETEEIETCADGNAPDADGCCAGEELTDVDGEYMCCGIGTDECFLPMI